MEYVELNNHVKMPILGYGVYQTPPEETERCVLDAIALGIIPSIRRRLTATKKASARPFKKAAFPVKSFSSRPKSGFQTAAMKKRKLPLKNRSANCAQAIWT